MESRNLLDTDDAINRLQDAFHATDDEDETSVFINLDDLPNDREDPPNAQHGLGELIEIRPTVMDSEPRLRPAQISMRALRFLLASIGGNYKNPLLAQPFGSLLDYTTVPPNLQFGITLSYTISSDRHDLIERLRLEGRGHAGLGFLAGFGKMLVATIPSSLLGAGIGAILLHFEDEIAKQPSLVLLTSPPASRLIAAAVSPILYLGTRKLIDLALPVPPFHFNQTPPLHILQRIAMPLLRIYDVTVVCELIHLLYKAYGPEAPLHHPLVPALAALIDQVLANFVDPLAFSKHAYDGAFPFVEAREMTTLPAPIELANQPTDAQNNNNIDTRGSYEESRGNVYRGTHTPFRCDNVKLTMWYSTRLATALAAGFLANLALSQLQSDKEQLSTAERMGYNAAIAAATVFTERFFEECLPWVIRKAASAASSCWSCLFTRNTPAADDTDADPLLDERHSPAL